MQFFKPENMFVVPMFVESMYKKIMKAVEDKKATKLFSATIKASNGLRKIGIDKRRKLFSSVWEAFGGNLQTIICGGAPLDSRYCKYFDDFGITLLNGYGITECSPVVAVNCNSNNKFGSVGLVLPNCEVKTVNEDENGNGEICVKGSSVMLGYYNNKQATEAAFDGDWFFTGDIGYLDSDNYLYISGRQKNLIILDNGKNIYPEELEELILRIPQAAEAVVYSENDVITAEIYTEDPAAVQIAVRAMNRGLPVYKRIRNLKFRTTEFEKTTTKKIKRNLLTKSR
jgi:long-chain acyl-CoA synthetase